MRLETTIKKNEIESTMIQLEERLYAEGAEYVSFSEVKMFPVQANEQKAIQVLTSFTKGKGSVAIPFYSGMTAKAHTLKERRDKEIEKLEKYKISQDIHNRKSLSAQCDNCKSKLTIKYLKSNACPVCGTSLLSKTVLDTIARYNSNIEKLHEQLEEEKKKTPKRREIMYLLSLEYTTTL